MSTSEIQKANLIEWIRQLSDDNMLSLLEDIRNADTRNDWWDDIPEAQKLHIEEGLLDAENGRTMRSAVFWERLHHTNR